MLTGLLRTTPVRSTSRRRVTGVFTALALAASTLTGLTLAPSAQASSNATAEAQFVSRINAARRSAGRPALSTSAQLSSVARAWARKMASGRGLTHNPSLTTQVTSWRYVGENVGVGSDVSTLNQAFMNSPGHRANILDRDYSQVGLGVAYGGGRLWVTQVFRKPLQASAASVRKTVRKATVRKSTKASTKVLRIGARGATVKKMQRKIGTYPDGIFGRQTLRKLKAYQKRYHLKVTGTLNAATRKRMRL